MNTYQEKLLHTHHGHTHAHPVAFFARLDARAVLLAWLAYTVLLISVPKFDPVGAAVFASLPVLVLTASGVRPGPIFRRLFYLSPFILLSAAANPFLDRRPFFEFGGIAVGAGMISGLVIIIKAFLSIFSVLTLAACMPFDHVCHAMRRLRVPEAFTTQLLLLHRYSFILADEAGSMRRARDIRSFAGRGKGPGVTARLIGSLLLRSTARATRIHDAMVSRGFHGTVSCCQEDHSFDRTDFFFLTGTAAFCLALRRFF